LLKLSIGNAWKTSADLLKAAAGEDDDDDEKRNVQNKSSLNCRGNLRVEIGLAFTVFPPQWNPCGVAVVAIARSVDRANSFEYLNE
jgi:hypothetical protein